MKVTYDGPYGSVDVHVRGENGALEIVTVEHGATEDFPEATANGLLAGGEWSKPKAATGGKTKE